MTIEKPSRELSVGEIITQAFSLYSSNFILFFTPFLVAGLITGTFSLAVNYYLPLPAPPAPEAPFEEIIAWLPGFIATLIAVALLTGIISWIISRVVEGTVVKCTSDLLEKGESSLSEGLGFTVSKLFSLLGAGIVTGILIAIGFVCLIIPGIILLIMFSLVVPAIIIEEKGVFESLGRSRRLVSRRWGKTFVLLLIVGIIIAILSAIAGLLAAPFGLASSIVSAIITALIQPILPLAMVLLYYSMIARESEVSATT